MALYAVLGDIHGNREALAAVVARLDALGVADWLCVGDLVGYNADGDACVALLRERGALCIAGNHDLIGTGRLGFERCSNKAMHSLKRTRRTLQAATCAWLRRLPAHAHVGDDVVLIHGGVRDVQQYMTRAEHFEQNARFLAEDHPRARICFYGHTHEQRVVEIDAGKARDVPATGSVTLGRDRTYFVNPGSVDASRKRADKLAEFALFDSVALTLAFERVPYDAALTEAKAVAGGYRIERWRDRLYELQRRLLAAHGGADTTA